MSYRAMQQTVEPNPRDVLCKVRLVPNGDHRISLEQDGSPLGLELSAQEARKAKALLEAALAEINFDDGRTTERIHPAVKWMG